MYMISDEVEVKRRARALERFDSESTTLREDLEKKLELDFSRIKINAISHFLDERRDLRIEYEESLVAQMMAHSERIAEDKYTARRAERTEEEKIMEDEVFEKLVDEEHNKMMARLISLGVDISIFNGASRIDF